MRVFQRWWLHPSSLALFISLVGSAFFAAFAVQRHNAFLTTAFDLGNYDQAVWNTAHGRLFQLTNIPNVSIRLAHHVEPILLLIAPFYWIWSDPRLLLILQASLTMLGAVPAYWLARRRLGDNRAALAFPLAWVLFPALEHAVLFDFHAVTLSSALLMAAFNWLDEERTAPFAVAALLAAWTKEEIGLLVALMGLYAIVVQRRHRFGVAVAVVGAGWSIVAFEVIIPYFSPAGQHVFLSYYEGLGDGLFGLMTTAFTRPDRIITRALAGGALEYLRDLLFPFLFLPIFAPHVLLIAGPSFAINLLSSYDPMRTLEGFHYPAPLVPFVVAAAILGLARLERWMTAVGRRHANVNREPHERGQGSTPFVGFGRRIFVSAVPSPGVVRIGAVLILVASLAYHIGHGATPLAVGFDWPRVTEHHRIGEEIIAEIPPDAGVSAQWQLNPHVSQRRRIYQFPDVRDADYVLIDVTINSWPQHPNDLYRDVQTMVAGEWGIAAARDGWLLLKRGEGRTTMPDAFYDFARVQTPHPGIPLDIRFGEVVRLIGIDRSETEDGVRTSFYWRREAGRVSNVELDPFYYDTQTGQVLEDTSRRPLVATLWYPPEQWQPGEMIRTRTLPWPVPEPYALGVVVRNAGAPLPPTNYMATPTVRYRPNGVMELLRVGTAIEDGRALQGPWMLGTAPAKIALLRAHVSDEAAFAASREYSLVLQWRASGPTEEPLTVFTQVLDAGGALVAQHDGPPAAGLRPTTDWRRGEVIPDPHRIPLPADMPAGTYRLIVGLYNPETGERIVAPGPGNAIVLTDFSYRPSE